MKERYFTGCGGTLAGVVDLTGVTARFIKLQVMEEYRSLYICGLSLSGEQVFHETNLTSNQSICESTQEAEGSASNNDVNINKEWSSWSNCSAFCGIGTQSRTRPCINNISDSSGASCRRMDTEYRTCKDYDSCFICSKRYEKCYNIIPELTSWRHAGNECWRRRMKLVSLSSLNELRFVKQLLRRETRYTRDRPSVAIDSLQGNTSYFTHIGIYRMLKKNQVVADYSEDYKPIIFSAW
ncbi:uncharacterized protein LOC123560052 [Mercenaria mercenaria]|uniref:uncharacterized protein LOC123560052 n=1 Tax=Mercenaria mercenaria TaxID=6596 RepID=UPI00234F784D|nr:uncharacterized protein LOC123560052 [Mercenaria mercenaria]